MALHGFLVQGTRQEDLRCLNYWSLMTMQNAAQFLISLTATYALSIALWPVLLSRKPGRWLKLAMSAIVLLTPFVIDGEKVRLRALACVLAFEAFFKMVDYARQIGGLSVGDETFTAYRRFLFPFPGLLVRFDARVVRGKMNVSCWPSTALAMVSFLCSFLILEMLSDTGAVRASFILDHSVKFVLFPFAVESLGRVIHGLERSFGYATTPLINKAFISRSVGEFWCRWNTRVHSWLICNVFQPCGGQQSSIRGVVATFFVSALFHEIAFAIATSRIDGYQFMFFLLQVPAVFASRSLQIRVRNNLRGQFFLRSATIVWMWFSSMLFLHGVDRVFPLVYAAKPWLP